MPRKPRVEYEGAVYHVMDRGDRLEAIYLDDGDRELFLKTLGEACERTGWRVHSYVLMSNHYHLLLETVEPNLSSGMQWLQSTYTIRHNVKHKLRGHLFQGRYKAIPVDGEDGKYFRTVSDYIHLNPVRAGLLEEGDLLSGYRWSSFPALSGSPRRRPDWLCAQWILDQGDSAAGRNVFRHSLEERAQEERRGGAIDKEMLKGLRRGWFFGSDEFRDGLLDRIKKSDRKGWEVARLHDEREAERIIEFGLGMWGLRKADLKTMPKGKPEKIAMACLVRKRTVMTNGWIAEKLHMGDPSRVSRYCSAGKEAHLTRNLISELEISRGKA